MTWKGAQEARGLLHRCTGRRPPVSGRRLLGVRRRLLFHAFILTTLTPQQRHRSTHRHINSTQPHFSSRWVRRGRRGRATAETPTPLAAAAWTHPHSSRTYLWPTPPPSGTPQPRAHPMIPSTLLHLTLPIHSSLPSWGPVSSPARPQAPSTSLRRWARLPG